MVTLSVASPHRDLRLRGPESAPVASDADDEAVGPLCGVEEVYSRLRPILAATAAAAARAASLGLVADDEDGAEL